MTGKKLGCPSSLVSYSHFSTDRTQYQGNSAMFSMRPCTSAREWRHKLCAVRMRNGNVRNVRRSGDVYTILHCFLLSQLVSQRISSMFLSNSSSISPIFQPTDKFSSGLNNAHQYVNVDPWPIACATQLSLVQIFQCSYSAQTLLIQFNSRQTKVRPKQRSPIRKFNVDPWPIAWATCLLI